MAGTIDHPGTGTNDASVLKVDQFGNVIWQKTYDVSTANSENTIAATNDGGYVVAGTFGGSLCVFKVDGNGNVTWQKSYAGDGIAHAIAPTSDGGYVVAGHTYSFGLGGDAWVLKLDGAGNLIWQKTYGGDGVDFAFAIKQTTNGYIVAGCFDCFGSVRDAWVLKLDSDGNVVWQKTYGGNINDSAQSITLTNDGGFIVAGVTFSFGAGALDALLLRLDANGNVMWQKAYGGSNNDGAYSVAATNDGGYVIAGFTDSFGAGQDAWVLKVDTNGSVVWQKTYGGSNREGANSIVSTNDGGFIIAGYANSFGSIYGGLWLLKLDANGNFDGSCIIANDSSATTINSSASVTNTSVASVISTATVTTSNASVANITAQVSTQCTNPTYSIAGRVIDGNSTPLDAVVWAGSIYSATTNSSGYYTLTGLINGAYTLTPATIGYYTFSPGSRMVSVPPDATGQDFIGTIFTPTNFINLPLIFR